MMPQLAAEAARPPVLQIAIVLPVEFVSSASVVTLEVLARIRRHARQRHTIPRATWTTNLMAYEVDEFIHSRFSVCLRTVVPR